MATTVTAHNYTKYILSIASNLSDKIQTFELPYNEYTFSTTTSAYKYAHRCEICGAAVYEDQIHYYEATQQYVCDYCLEDLNEEKENY